MAIAGGYKGWVVITNSKGKPYPTQTTIADKASANSIEFDYFTFGASAHVNHHTGNAVGGLHKDMVTFVTSVGAAAATFAAAVATSDKFPTAVFTFTNQESATAGAQMTLTLQRGSVAAVRWIFDGGSLKQHISLAYAAFKIDYKPIGKGEAGKDGSMAYDYELKDVHGGAVMP